MLLNDINGKKKPNGWAINTKAIGCNSCNYSFCPKLLQPATPTAFSPERNYLDAHLTLFHALPDEPWIIEDLKNLVEDRQPFDVTAQLLYPLAIVPLLKSFRLPFLHQKLQKSWFDFLSNQDRQKRNFHITIQNKVESVTAKKLQAEITPGCEPFSFTIHGIQLWRYQQGPWEYLMRLNFGNDTSQI